MLNAENHITDDLLVSYLLDEADEDARGLVEQWIQENPENRRYFDHFSIIWEASKVIEASATVDPHAAWQRFKKRTAAAEPTTVPKNLNSRAVLKIAASVIVVLSVFAVFYAVWNKMDYKEVLIAAGEQPVTNTLPDGSLITLNKQSSIAYSRNLQGEDRRIKLKGEAFFDVKPDKRKPFIIEVDDVTVTVLGTSFNIKKTDGNVEIIVETGAVMTVHNNKTVIVKEKEKVVIENDTLKVIKDDNNDKLYNYYRTNEFMCDNTPLWRLVEVLNEAYQSNIIIEDKELRELPLTTTFHNESLDNILNIISVTFNVTIEKRDDTIILK